MVFYWEEKSNAACGLCGHWLPNTIASLERTEMCRYRQEVLRQQKGEAEGSINGRLAREAEMEHTRSAVGKQARRTKDLPERSSFLTTGPASLLGPATGPESASGAGDAFALEVSG